MPNWCENILKISGKKADVEEFLAGVAPHDHSAVDNRHFDFQRIIPYPKEFEEMDRVHEDRMRQINDMTREDRASYLEKHELPRDGFNSGGYEWRLINWGTKWNAVDTALSRHKGYAKIEFLTAWAPPVPIIFAAAERFPNVTLSLKYYEGGNGFKGTVDVKGKETLKVTESEYRGCRGG